ncbi:NAD(P)-dependent oxidoreductase [Nocardiopsis alba]|uniref:NAD(P)-dependent oxidoreductase n=1 Tax=Nocardiopsis alba TaxID=53437 RepID=UPI0003498388|nr:NAD(P)-binding domain-containing protein [Nocardiopsis alba]
MKNDGVTKGSVALLGLGAMGRVLAERLLDAGHPVTVWNRTPGRDTELVERGARRAETVREAVTAATTVVTCLFDHASVRETLEPVGADLAGRTLVDLTTTTPNEARWLGGWAEERGIEHLDGAIMATPSMIGAPEASLLYSGSAEAFGRHRTLFEVWGSATYDGADHGAASLFDLALLSGMYTMFTGFAHGAAMVTSAGVTAEEFAHRSARLLSAMTGVFPMTAKVIDEGDYTGPGQSLEWTATALDTIARASAEQGVSPGPIEMTRALVLAQIEAGYGNENSDRIYEELRAG